MTMGQGTDPEVNPCPISTRFTRSLPAGQGAFFASAQLSACCTEPVVRVVSVVVKKQHIPLSSQFSIFNSQFSIHEQYFPDPAVIHTHRSEVRLQ